MSKMEDEMTAFQIDERDNVATALKVLEPGTVRLLGDSREKKLSVREEIPAGHKVALTDIAAGENIVKYGVVIVQRKISVRGRGFICMSCAAFMTSGPATLMCIQERRKIHAMNNGERT